MPGRPRKTKAEMLLTGADEKHPERMADRGDTPKPKGPLGDPPASFNPQSPSGSALIEIWHELVAQVPAGVLTLSDRMHVELTCRLMLRVRSTQAKSGDYSRLDAMLGKIACNPADRKKVNLVVTGAVVAKSGTNDGDTTGTPGGNTFRNLAEEASPGRPN